MRSNTMLNKLVFVSGFSRQPEGNGSGHAGGGFQPSSYRQPEGNGSGHAGGGFLPPAL
jgi:hypothetical protein